MVNGVTLYDTSGDVIHSHGGWIVEENGYYYWFGENRTGDIRVSCYRTKDFKSFEFRNHVLTLDSPTREHYVRTNLSLRKKFIAGDGSEIIKGCNIERPKVLYNRKNGQYVMWMHYENGADYRDARCAVAVCDSIDGDYVYMGSFNPVGNMSRDCSVFIDDDGTAYFMSAARDNGDMIIYRLSEDYLSIDEQVKVLWPGQYREAPALFKRDGLYYLITSECTGWAPNQGGYAVAKSVEGRWSSIEKFGDETTYQSQAAFVLPVMQNGKTEYMYFGDRWDGKNYAASTYVVYTICFNEDKSIYLKPQEEFFLQS